MIKGRNTLPAPEADPRDSVTLDAEIEQSIAGIREVSQDLALAEQQRVANVRAVAQQIGYQLPGDSADPDLIQRDVIGNMRRTAEAMLQVGLGLICLKEACRHGEFMARLDVLGFEPSVARRYMSVAKKLSNRATSHVLLKAFDSQSKLLELIVLDDDQIEELELTGQTGELKLDDIASMSVKELRAAVRELKGDIKAKENLLAHKSGQLDQAALIQLSPPNVRLDAMLADATHQLNDTRGALIGRFSAAIAAIDAHHQEHGGDSMAFMAGQVGQLQADITALRDRYGIPDVVPALIPAWVTDPNFKNFAN
ncbi:MAG: hypothetical protein WBJ68_14045 [Candidatus Dechloromonas phosphoritropha]